MSSPPRSPPWSPQRWSAALCASAALLLVVLRPRAPAASPRERAWLEREARARLQRLQALSAAASSGGGDNVDVASTRALMDAAVEALRACPGGSATNSELRAGLRAAAGRAAADMDRGEEDVAWELMAMAGERGGVVWEDVNGVLAPAVQRARARALQKRARQLSKTAELVWRARQDAPLLVFSAAMAAWSGVLDAAKFFFASESLSLAFAQAQSKREPSSSSSSSWQDATRSLLFAHVLSTAAGVLRELASRMGRRNFVLDMKSDLFAALLRQDLEFFETNDLWDVRHLIGNTDGVCASMLNLPFNTIEGLARVAASVWLLFKQSPTMLAVVALALGVKTAMAHALDLLQKRLELMQEMPSPRAGALLDLWQSLIDVSAIKTMRMFAREYTEVADFTRISQAKDRADESDALAYQILSPVRDLLDRLLDVLGIWYGGRLVSANRMRAADLPTFVSLATDTFERTRLLMAYLGQAQDQILTPMERMYDLLHAKPKIGLDVPKYEDSQARFGSAVGGFSFEFKNVSFAYPTRPESLILNHLDLTVREGERVGIMGESGCGKSTLFALLTRLYQPTSGEVLIAGTPVSAFNPCWLRERIAVVTQGAFMPSRTIWGNLMYGRFREHSYPPPTHEGKDKAEEEGGETALMADIRQALDQAHCSFFLTDTVRFPQGLFTDIGVNAGKLSGGERQRLALARALMLDPPPRLLLLDEHTAALDELTQRAVQISLDELWKQHKGKLTIVSIAHRLSNFRGVDRVVVLKDGRVAEQGPPRDLLREFPDGLFAGYVRTSMEEFL